MISKEESRRFARPVQVPPHELQLISSEVRGLELAAYALTEGYEPEKQPIMCDFEVVADEVYPSRFFITLAVEMENAQKADGRLSFHLSSVTEFEYQPGAKPTALPEGESARWQLFYIGVSTAIGLARGYLTNYLAPTIYRGYQLPLLNVEELMKKKYERPALPPVPSTAPSEKPTTTRTRKKASEE